MYVLDRAHVQSARGLHRDYQRHVAVEFARDYRLLLIAARQRARLADYTIAAAHVVLVNQLLCIVAHRAEFYKAMALELRVEIALKHHVLLQRVIQHQAVLLPVLGDMAHSGLLSFAHGRASYVLAAQVDAAAVYLFKAGQRVYQLGLAVAVYARDAHDFAPAHVERNAVHRIALIQVRRDMHVADLQHWLARMRIALVHLQLYVAAHYHAGQLFLIGVAGIDRADVPALAQHGHAVGYLHYFAQLMRYEQYALALGGQPTHYVHQFLNLLRSKHCGGLVKYQHLVIAIQHFEYLDALLHTDGNAFDLGVQIDL